ncbi:sarcosine oxidase subunit gamma [Neptunicoccus sediminis]|uniref:sarcosine oxidase subunit gamma n=1 Tax=Neptunicoccus sediminis TaxID=1892596 RepID=UPI000845D039|nr:sarcosine oxidase subunit gamma family protein [Neptunicoccus sediminis]
MSDAVSVVNGASFDGAVQVKDAGLVGMVTLRGDLGSEKLASGVKSAIGLTLPEARGVKAGTKGGVAWMSPDELLLFCDYEQADALVGKLDKALAGEHFLAVNVSDARASFTLTGSGVREVIAKGSPADLSPEAFKQGEIRRSRLGQVAVAFWLSAPDTMELVCFRSVGEFVYDWLCVAAEKGSLPEIFNAG